MCPVYSHLKDVLNKRLATPYIVFFFPLQLVHFSDRTTKGLAADNSDLRDQLKRVRGQLVEAQKNNKIPSKNESAQEQNAGSGNKGGEGGKSVDGVNGDSGEGGRVELYKAQIKDLNKRLAQLQEVHTRRSFKCVLIYLLHPSLSHSLSPSLTVQLTAGK